MNWLLVFDVVCGCCVVCAYALVRFCVYDHVCCVNWLCDCVVGLRVCLDACIVVYVCVCSCVGLNVLCLWTCACACVVVSICGCVCVLLCVCVCVCV